VQGTSNAIVVAAKKGGVCKAGQKGLTFGRFRVGGGEVTTFFTARGGKEPVTDGLENVKDRTPIEKGKIYTVVTNPKKSFKQLTQGSPLEQRRDPLTKLRKEKRSTGWEIHTGKPSGFYSHDI